MKQLTPILNILHFQCFKLIRSGQVFHVLFTNAYFLICNQIVCFAFFFRQTLTLLPSVVFLKPVSIFSQALKICYSKVVYCLHVHVILVQLTIRGSGKHKQTITKLPALPGGIKTYTFRNSGGDTVQTKLSRRSPQD